MPAMSHESNEFSNETFSGDPQYVEIIAEEARLDGLDEGDAIMEGLKAAMINDLYIEP